MNATITRPASSAQVRYITSLISERVADAEDALAWTEALATAGVREASGMIETLKGMPRSTPKAPEITEGMYVLDGEIYKVQRAVHGSGNLYAKHLTPSGFEYAAGVVRRLAGARPLTIEEAKAYGALYGTCAVCGRTLTDEDSIAAGIGPVCASKF